MRKSTVFPVSLSAHSGLVELRRRGRQAWSASGQAVNVAIARGARSYPCPAMAADGYVVRRDFLGPAELAAAMLAVAPYQDRRTTVAPTPESRVVDRNRRDGHDQQVRQLMRAETISPVLSDLFRSGAIEATMSELTGRNLRLGGMTVQIDWPDTTTKRGLHVDSHWPPTYKAFVYLSDVPGPENGPFSLVPGSHRHRARKVRAVLRNHRGHRPRTDLDVEYSLAEARCVLGPAGTAIFADQRLAHAGWPGHTTGVRFMLVNYLYEAGVAAPRFLR